MFHICSVGQVQTTTCGEAVAEADGLHALRHPHVSVPLQAGEPIYAVAWWLVHADPALEKDWLR